MKIFVSVFYYFITISTSSSSSKYSQEWISCSVNLSALYSSTQTKHITEKLVKSSLTACISRATVLTWPYLACYFPVNNTCVLWSEQALSVGRVVRDATLGNTNCKTLHKPLAECQLPNGTIGPVGSVWTYTVCPAIQDVCHSDGLLRGKMPDSAPKYSSCKSPFTSTSYGCTLRTTTSTGWCEARAYCLSIGGDLYVPDTDQQFTNLKNAFAGIAPGLQNWLWLGVVKQQGVWRWLSTGRDPYVSHDWHPTEPQYDQCGHLYSDYNGIGLADYACTAQALQAICEANISS